MHALARMLVVSAPATMFEFTHVGTNLYICQFLLHGLIWVFVQGGKSVILILSLFLEKTREKIRLPEIFLLILAQAHPFRDSCESKLNQWVSLCRAWNERIISPEIIKPGHLRILHHQLKSLNIIPVINVQQQPF